MDHNKRASLLYGEIAQLELSNYNPRTVPLIASVIKAAEADMNKRCAELMRKFPPWNSPPFTVSDQLGAAEAIEALIQEA